MKIVGLPAQVNYKLVKILTSTSEKQTMSDKFFESKYFTKSPKSHHSIYLLSVTISLEVVLYSILRHYGLIVNTKTNTMRKSFFFDHSQMLICLYTFKVISGQLQLVYISMKLMQVLATSVFDKKAKILNQSSQTRQFLESRSINVSVVHP